MPIGAPVYGLKPVGTAPGLPGCIVWPGRAGCKEGCCGCGGGPPGAWMPLAGFGDGDGRAGGVPACKCAYPATIGRGAPAPGAFGVGTTAPLLIPGTTPGVGPGDGLGLLDPNEVFLLSRGARAVAPLWDADLARRSFSLFSKSCISFCTVANLRSSSLICRTT